jgi:hypothetical protein
MEILENIQELYQHIDEKAMDYMYLSEISTLFQKLRDKKHEDGDTEQSKKAQWEVDIFNFRLIKNELKPRSIGTDENGNNKEYPTLDNFDQETYKYLIQRAHDVSNPRLKAQYSHMLWLSPAKNIEYAYLTVDSYLSLIELFENKDRQEPGNHYGLTVIDIAENVFMLSRQVKYKTRIIKTEIIRLVNDFNFDSSSFFIVRAKLIELMLANRKSFVQNDFNNLTNISLIIADKLINKKNINAAIVMYELGEKIDNIQNIRTDFWKIKIAESYEFMMTLPEYTNNLAVIDFCLSAIDYYKKIKDNVKVKELEKKYIELKTNMHLGEIKEKITNNSSDDIIKLLTFQKNILPKYNDMLLLAEEQHEQFAFRKMLGVEHLDRLGNTTQHFTDDEEKKYHTVLENYTFELQFNKMYLINELFYQAYLKNKLSPEIILNYMRNNSWYGKNICKQLPNNIKMEYNWLSLIAPAIYEYYTQLHLCFLSPNNQYNLILCIDSLTLKIEGLIRDICTFTDVPTFNEARDNKGRIITKEKDVHALLYEDVIKQMFDEDDLLLFKFLLVEKAGFNLRHRIAHCLMIYDEYNFFYMHLLIITLLRIGKYDFIKNDDNNDEEKAE